MGVGRLPVDGRDVPAATRPTPRRGLRYGAHFEDRDGPTIVARANSASNGQEAELDEALNQFCDEWNRGTADDARFEQEYLVAVGKRA